MSKLVKGIIAVICIAILGGGIYLYKYISDTKKYKDIIAGIEINSVDLSNVKDGTFEGSFDAILVGADVSVSVKDKKITDIKLISHKNEKGKDAEVMPKKVVQAQSLEVDTVSGATNSSKVILKAIENALESGQE